jgi:hypothetical protein
MIFAANKDVSCYSAQVLGSTLEQTRELNGHIIGHKMPSPSLVSMNDIKGWKTYIEKKGVCRIVS